MFKARSGKKRLYSRVRKIWQEGVGRAGEMRGAKWEDVESLAGQEEVERNMKITWRLVNFNNSCFTTA